MDLVNDLTGKALAADDWVEMLNVSLESKVTLPVEFLTHERLYRSLKKNGHTKRPSKWVPH
jgi:hypothetical protein